MSKIDINIICVLRLIFHSGRDSHVRCSLFFSVYLFGNAVHSWLAGFVHSSGAIHVLKVIYLSVTVRNWSPELSKRDAPKLISYLTCNMYTWLMVHCNLFAY